MPARVRASGRSLFVLLVGALLLVATLTLAPSAQAGSLDELDARLGEEVDDPAAVWAGDAAYVFGGATGSVPATFTDAIWRVDPAAGTVEEADATLPSPRRDAGAAWTGDHVYLFGGYGCAPNTDGDRSCRDVMRYDPASDTLETLDVELPAPDTPVAVWTGQQVYLVGQRQPDVHRFDPSTGELTTHEDVLGDWRDGLSAVWDGSDVLVFPGNETEVRRFDPSSGTVVETGHHLPGPRADAGAVWTGQAVHLFAGETDEDRLDEIVRYDPDAGGTDLDGVRLPGDGDARVPAVWNGSAALLFAYDSAATYSDRILAYDPANVAPRAAAEVTVDARTVHVDANGSTDPDGEIVSHTWHFDDGTTASGPTAEHTYDEVGTYTVELVVEDDDGATGTNETAIEVENSAPSAPLEAHLDRQTVHVSAAEAGDPDGEIESYTWDFGDGTTAHGANASHRYESKGSYTVELVVEDDDGATRTNETVVEVDNLSPVPSVDISVDHLTVTVSAAEAGDPDGEVESYAWDFGDGATAEGVEATHAYARHGNHTVQLTVTDDNGTQVSTNRTVPAPNHPPEPEFTVERQGLRVTVDARDSSDPDGHLTSHRIAWGDGDKTWDRRAAHAYPFPDSFRIEVTVVDDDGREASLARTIDVEPADQNPVASIDATVDGTTVRLDAGASHARTGELDTYRWHLGDGTTATGAQVEHTFAEPGAYTVTLNVTDDLGQWDTATDTVHAYEADEDPGDDPRPPAPDINVTADGLTVLAHVPDEDVDDDANYAWRFGDESDPVEGPEATHEYDEPGNYTVTLAIEGPDGGTRTIERALEVNRTADDDPAAGGGASVDAASDASGRSGGSSGPRLAEEGARRDAPAVGLAGLLAALLPVLLLRGRLGPRP